MRLIECGSCKQMVHEVVAPNGGGLAICLRCDGLLEATTLVCAYCADPDNWQPAKKGTYPEWWHLSAHGFNVRNQCSAWAIHYKLAR